MFPILFAFLFLLLVAAAPEPRTTPVFAKTAGRTLVPIETAYSAAGKIVYYGFAGVGNITTSSAVEGLSSDNEHQKRCGSNQVFCDGANVPNADLCHALIYTGLQHNTNPLPPDAAALCVINSNSGQCCISWTARPSYLPNLALFNAAAAVFSGCVANGASGITADTNLGGVCCYQCLSNRPDGCVSCR